MSSRSVSTILGKRTFEEALGLGHDEARYNQPIGEDFFEKGVGHNVVVQMRQRDSASKYDAGEMQIWWENILYSNKKVNVNY